MKAFLNNTFGKQQGQQLYQAQQTQWQNRLLNTRNKTNTQMKTIRNRIMPLIALYFVLVEHLGDKTLALSYTESYVQYVAGKFKCRLLRMEKLPGFYFIMRNLMLWQVKRSDNWQVEIGQNDRQAFCFNITRCLWNDTCHENMCPELCKLFCNADDIMFGTLTKVSFVRTQTLGYGKPCCDFVFLNTKVTSK